MQLLSTSPLLDAEKIAAGLPALMIEVDRVAATIVQGVHGRRRKGVGETFWEYRRFAREDPAFRIDWRQSAKSDALYVRENEWEAAQGCWLWVDDSPSMPFQSETASVSKFNRALVLGLACASLLLQAGERVADLSAAQPPRHGVGALERLADGFLTRERTATPDSLPPLPSIGPYSEIVLIGDFFVDLEALAQRFKAYAERRYRVHVVQVVDPAEEDLPYRGRTRFEGVEDHLSFLAGDVEHLRGAYAKRFQAHRDTLRAMCAGYGWSFTAHRTDHSAEGALLALYMSLSGGIV